MDKSKFAKLKELAAEIMGFGSQKQPDAPEKFEAFQIKGGDTMVEFNPTLEIGSPVMVSSGTGSDPAPNGSYEFESGVKFKTEEGKISEVESDGSEEETEEEKKKKLEEKQAKEKMSISVADFETFKSEVMAIITPLSEKFTLIEGQFATAKEGFSKVPSTEVLTAYKEQLAAIGEAMEAFSLIPVQSPVDQKEEAFNQTERAYELIANAFIGEQK